jgi:Na+-driven multidrug efflux pump
MDKVHILAPFYFCMGVWVILTGVVRGCGEAFLPMIVGVASMFLVRVPVAFLLPQKIGANGIHWSLAIVWIVEATVMALYYVFYFKKRKLSGTA